ncbi:MAG: glycosyltransferase, partial [Candidatus Hinthialibacter sp.]
GLLRVLSKPNSNLYVFSPIIIPFIGKRKFQKFYTKFIFWQVKVLLHLIRFNNPIIWSANLSSVHIIPKFQKRLLVFYCEDKMDKNRYVKNKKILEEYDLELTQMSDVILCSSYETYSFYQKKLAPGRAFYIPHAINTDLFVEAYQNDTPLPEDIAKIKKPIIGFHGALTSSKDIDLLHYCASKRPDWSFVLIGRITDGDYQPLKELPNIHFLGYKPFEQIPYYIKGYDVGIIFRKLSEWTRFCNPTKTNEYLIMGKPVVSVDIPEIRKEYSNVIYIAKNPKEFLQGIEHELMTDSPEKIAKRRAKVIDRSYDNQVKQIISIMLKKIDASKN